MARAASCSGSSQTHTDPNTGQTWGSAFTCGNDENAPLYAGANDSTLVGSMVSTSSWFVCYRHGAPHAGGNDVWYYSQGDRSTPGWEGRLAWGYMPAVNLHTSVDPAPGIPECQPALWQVKEAHADGHGRSFAAVWYGKNDANARLYGEASTAHPAGTLTGTTSWFACYTHGATHAGGNDVWYYTLGDTGGWGYLPAANVRAPRAPYDSVPACSASNGGGDENPPPTCAEPLMTYFPVRGRHETGYQSNPSSGNSSIWTCDDANSNSDYFSAGGCGHSGGHYGNDIWAAEGTPVVASVSGEVVQAELSSYSGNQVRIRDACGWSHYSIHLQRIADGIQVGRHVDAGEVIGYVGHTGSASNGVVHLHFSIYPQNYCQGINPWPYLHQVEQNVCSLP